MPNIYLFIYKIVIMQNMLIWRIWRLFCTSPFVWDLSNVYFHFWYWSKFYCAVCQVEFWIQDFDSWCEYFSIVVLQLFMKSRVVSLLALPSGPFGHRIMSYFVGWGRKREEERLFHGRRVTGLPFFYSFFSINVTCAGWSLDQVVY